MGACGAAFTTTIDPETWDPLAAAPLDDATLGRAARAAAVRVDRVTPPFDDEMRELVLERIVEAIDAKLPPLVRGAVGPPEFGLIVGYEDPAGRMDGAAKAHTTFLVRTYFDRGEEPTRIGWDAFVGGSSGEPFFLDRAERPGRDELVRGSIALAAEAAGPSDAAMRAWLAALRDEGRWTDPKHEGRAAFADHVMRTILADKRRAAARYLRSIRGSVSPGAGADLLRAAEAYGHVADASERAGIGPFDPGAAARFVEGGHRRAWANLLETAIGHEAAAHDAIRSALSMAGGSAPFHPR